MANSDKYIKKCKDRVCKEWFMLATLDSNKELLMSRIEITKKKIQKEMVALIAISTTISIAVTFCLFQKCKCR